MSITEEQARTAAAGLGPALFLHSPDALLLVDPLSERVLDANAEAARLTELGRGDLVGASVRSLVRHEQEWQDWLTSAPAAPADGFLLRAPPPRAWLPVALWLRRLPGGEPLLLVGARDRTDLLDARRRAARAEAELRRALAGAADALFCCHAERDPDAEGGWRWRYRYLAPAAERLTGCSLSHLLESPLNWRGAVAPDDRAAWTAFRARLLEGRGGELTYRLLRPDGAVVRAREQAAVTPGENGWVITGSVAGEAPAPAGDDDDARQRAAEGRCEGIAALAGGVAHDLNNLITGVLGHVSLARLTGLDLAGEVLDQVEAGAQRAAELGKQLALLSGRARAAARPVDLNDAVRDLAVACGARFEPGELPPVPAERDLVRAAAEQMLTHAAARGEVAVRTYLATGPLGEPGLWLPRAAEGAGPWAVVEVRDGGPELAPDALARLFDPFFTTRPGERGLGLAGAVGTARAHRGLIHARSAPGDTRLRLLLPAPAAPAAPRSPSAQGTAVAVPPRLSGATVLLADDEEAVRHVVGRLLEPLGCRVVAAGDGDEAVACFREHGASVALVDLTMPRLGGEAVLRELRRLAPGLPLVVMSGLPEGDIMPRFAELNVAAYLQKPFRLPGLLEALGQALPAP